MSDNNHISEGQALDEWLEVMEYDRDHAIKQLEEAYDQLTTQMHEAKHAEVGATIQCAQCGKRIVKKTYHKVFCSNAKTHGNNNCKDRYHNRINGIKEYLNIIEFEQKNSND